MILALVLLTDIHNRTSQLPINPVLQQQLDYVSQIIRILKEKKHRLRLQRLMLMLLAVSLTGIGLSIHSTIEHPEAKYGPLFAGGSGLTALIMLFACVFLEIMLKVQNHNLELLMTQLTPLTSLLDLVPIQTNATKTPPPLDMLDFLRDSFRVFSSLDDCKEPCCSICFSSDKEQSAIDVLPEQKPLENPVSSSSGEEKKRIVSADKLQMVYVLTEGDHQPYSGPYCQPCINKRVELQLENKEVPTDPLTRKKLILKDKQPVCCIVSDNAAQKALEYAAEFKNIQEKKHSVQSSPAECEIGQELLSPSVPSNRGSLTPSDYKRTTTRIPINSRLLFMPQTSSPAALTDETDITIPLGAEQETAEAIPYQTLVDEDDTEGDKKNIAEVGLL